MLNRKALISSFLECEQCRAEMATIARLPLKEQHHEYIVQRFSDAILWMTRFIHGWKSKLDNLLCKYLFYKFAV